MSLQWSHGQEAECILQPALASADEKCSCLVVAHSLISGCNRIQGQMLKAPGPREDRCPAAGPCRQTGLHTHIHICSYAHNKVTWKCRESVASHLSLLIVSFVPRMGPDRNAIDNLLNEWMDG